MACNVVRRLRGEQPKLQRREGKGCRVSKNSGGRDNCVQITRGGCEHIDSYMWRQAEQWHTAREAVFE